MLRLIDEEGIDPRELPKRACLSKRAIRAMVGHSERQGWVTVETNLTRSRTKIVRLTVKGEQARGAWEQLSDAARERWQTRFGAPKIVTLRTALEGLVGQLALELPHYPIGYGPADASITGGNGQDWSPVLRGDRDCVSGLSLPALLAQSLVAFTLEYEQEAGIALPLSANILRFLSLKGLPLKDLATLSEYSQRTIFLGTLERHGYVVIERDPADPRTHLVRLTHRGQLAHTRYYPLLAEIERRWRTHYGAEEVQAVRTSLEALAHQFDPGLPHHPR